MDRTPNDQRDGDDTPDPVERVTGAGPPAHERGADGTRAVVVTVTRTGGFAGLRKVWKAEAEGDDAGYWIELIEQCPWESVVTGREPKGADRFLWLLDARCGDDEREAELADPDVDGPWRNLIEAVREAGAAPERPRAGR